MDCVASPITKETSHTSEGEDGSESLKGEKIEMAFEEEAEYLDSDEADDSLYVVEDIKVCSEDNCESCKKQQLAYCFLNFHPCSFLRSRKCSFCHDFSRFLAKCSQPVNNVVHLGARDINCILCGELFDSVRELKVHSCTVIKLKTYNCFMCPTLSRSLHQLMKHMYIHCGLLPHQCQSCDSSFETYGRLRKHEIDEHEQLASPSLNHEKKHRPTPYNEDDEVEILSSGPGLTNGSFVRIKQEKNQEPPTEREVYTVDSEPDEPFSSGPVDINLAIKTERFSDDEELFAQMTADTSSDEPVIIQPLNHTSIKIEPSEMLNSFTSRMVVDEDDLVLSERLNDLNRREAEKHAVMLDMNAVGTNSISGERGQVLVMEPEVLQCLRRSVLARADGGRGARKFLMCRKEACSQCTNNKAAICFKYFHFCKNPDNPVLCSVCYRIQSHLDNIMNPRADGMIHINSPLVQCCFCLSNHKDIEELGRHKCKFVFNGKNYRCHLCGVSFTIYDRLITHIFHHYKIKPFFCNICSKDFVSSQEKDTHEKSHFATKKHKCEICNSEFLYARDLRTHMYNHGTTKPYKCDECGRTFSARYMLKEHAHTHSDTKPWSCSKCERSFIKRRTLERHIFQKHQAGGVNCDICGKRLCDIANMQSHKLLHETENLHRCPQCKKGYTTTASLKRHLLVHSSARVFCSHCSYSTYYKFQLRMHELRHAERKPFQCHWCVREFLQRRSFVAHEKKCPLRGLPNQSERMSIVRAIQSDFNEDVDSNDSLVIAEDTDTSVTSSPKVRSPNNSVASMSPKVRSPNNSVASTSPTKPKGRLTNNSLASTSFDIRLPDTSVELKSPRIRLPNILRRAKR